MSHKFLRIVSLIIIFSFIWTHGSLFSIAHAAKISVQESQKEKVNQKNNSDNIEKDLEKAIQSIGEILDDSEKDLNDKKQNIKTKKKEIETLDIEIQKQFTETEKRLKQAGLSTEILNRHYEFIAHYNENLNLLKANLDSQLFKKQIV